MAGITGVGMHIPLFRLSRAEVDRYGGEGDGREKALAGYDEDSLTMAVAASLDCMGRPAGEKQAPSISGRPPRRTRKNRTPRSLRLCRI